MNAIAERYATALFNLALEEKLDHTLKEQVQLVLKTIQAHPELIRLFGQSQVSPAEKHTILEDIYRDVTHPYLLHVLKLMVDKHRQRYIGLMLEGYLRLYNQHHNILEAIAYTVQALSDEEIKTLENELSLKEKRTVHVSNRLDPTLLSGIKISYGDKVLDASMRSRIKSLRTNLLKERA